MVVSDGPGTESVAESVESTVGREDLALVPVGRAFRAMLKAFERDTGVSAPRWFVLSMISEDEGGRGVSQGEVCRRFDLDPSRVTRLAQGLEADGLIHRQRDPDDSRVVRMSLTEKGGGLVRQFPERRTRFDQRVAGTISVAEMGELRRMLGVLEGAMKN